MLAPIRVRFSFATCLEIVVLETYMSSTSIQLLVRLACVDLFVLCSANPSTGISVAVTTTDNCVHVINTASMREDWTVRSLCITSRQVSVPLRQTTDASSDGAAANQNTTEKSAEDNDEHQFLGINRAAASRAQAHTLPFIQSDHHWRSTLAVEPRSQWLVSNGYPGQLQAFDRTSQALSHAYQVIHAPYCGLCGVSCGRSAVTVSAVITPHWLVTF
jgi:hypothetical protein